MSNKRPLPASLKKITYRDFDLQFRSHPATGKLLIKKDDDAVKQALKNLILTNHYERPFLPEYGGNIRSRLFDNFDTITAGDFENQIVNAIKNYEPRASLEGENQPVTVIENFDRNELTVTIRFRNTSTLNDLTLDVNLNRVR
jgi:phage baseplate assembly protein W